MITLRKKLEEAAFWDGWVCLRCGNTEDEGGRRSECGECGSTEIHRAKEALAFVRLLEGEDED